MVRIKPIFTPIGIFLLVFAIYYLSNLHPLDWYKHYVFLSESFLKGRLDVPQLPEYYQDVINFNDKKFLPFAPAPAIVLMPLIAVFGTSLDMVRVSMVIGASNVVLLWLILERLSLKPFVQLLLTLGFAFGTVHFYAATTGTTWFFAHTMAVFFLSLAILEKFGKSRPFILGFLVGLAFLSREPTILAASFFLWSFLKQKRKDKRILFLLGISPFLIFLIIYNFLRFGNIFEAGYEVVYNYYVKSGIHYSFLRALVPPEFPHFNQLDIRNIPLHFITIFLMPPKFTSSWPFLTPSPFGMSILLTSPFLIWSIFSKSHLTKILWLTIIAIALPNFLFYAQGWVQFGYRFALDFLPFLMILTAWGFEHKPSRLILPLVLFSILVNFWGNWWAKAHGW